MEKMNKIHDELEGVEKIVTSPVEKEVQKLSIPRFVVPKATQDEVKVTPYMTESLEKVALAEGFKNFTVKFEHGSVIGDGFIAIVLKATISETDNDKQLTVIIKSPPDSQARRQNFGSMALFKREVFVYSQMLPEFAKFQQEMKIDESLVFFEFPKCYFAEYNEEKDDAIIIMEDMRESGYKMWNKFNPVNFEHTRLSVISLGKLHAISFAMKKLKPEVFEKFQKVNDFMSESFGDHFVTMTSSNIDQAANTLDPEDIERRNRVLSLKENLGETMKDMVNPDLCEPFAVVTHGDSWTNNYMYHYQHEQPDKTVLLDWQITRYCSPVLDLMYFIFVSTDGALREKHFDELLKIYYQSLTDTLDSLGGNTATQFPFEVLLSQVKQYGKFGVIMSAFMMFVVTTPSEDLPDMNFMAENMTNPDPEIMADLTKIFMFTNKTYDIRMRELLHDAIRYGFF